MRTIFLALLFFTIGALVAGCGKKAAPTDDEQKDTAQKQQVPGAPTAPKKAGGDRWCTFTIGKSTTYVTGPVQKDGHIDYAAALNERLSKGVTPENNANVGICKALGPNPVTLRGGKEPAGFFDKLGMQSPLATARSSSSTALSSRSRAGGTSGSTASTPRNSRT